MYKNAFTPSMLVIVCLGLFLLGFGCESKNKAAYAPVFSSDPDTTHEMTFDIGEGDTLYSISDAPIEPEVASALSLETSTVSAQVPPLPAPPILNYNGFMDGHDDPREPTRKETVLFADEFSTTFDVGTTTQKWLYFSVPGFVSDDGLATITNGVLNVRSSTTNMNNEPVFTKTVPQDTLPGQLSGQLDHVKFLATTNQVNPTTNVPGFPALVNKELVCETLIRGRTFNTGLHPFGAAAVTNDPRLAAVALISIDLETLMVFDFILTNDKIYALYERLPGNRPTLGNYAAFTYHIDVGSRTPSTYHRLAISYNPGTGVVRWLVNGVEVFKVTEIGKLIGTNGLTVNLGGDEPAVPLQLNQLNCGMGQLTLLDGFIPTENALVKLSGLPAFYRHPITNLGLTFVDELSLTGSRLFGQGASMDLKSFTVKYVTFE